MFPEDIERDQWGKIDQNTKIWTPPVAALVRIRLNQFTSHLTPFMPFFYAPWKHQKIWGLPMFPEDIERDQWGKIDQNTKIWSDYLFKYGTQNLLKVLKFSGNAQISDEIIKLDMDQGIQEWTK